MSPLLYKFNLEDHHTEFQQFLVNCLPTTVSLLGWFVGTGFYDSDPAGKCDIWTCHPDPLDVTNEPVVWIFDSDHRIRVYITSEVVLDFGELTKEAIELADKGVYPKELPKYFVGPQLEALYIKSKEILKPVIQHYMYEIKKDTEFVLLHGPNCLWGPVFHEILDVKMDTPCFKFVKPITSFDATKAIVLPDNLKMSTLEKADVNLVHSTNKIAYDISYVEDCFRISSAIRTFDNNELAAWSMTHRDLFVGSLHVLPEYRRRGCAEIILQDLCRQYAEYYRRTLPDTLAEKAYFGSAVEKFNDSSANLFTKTGWKSVGLGITWIYAGKKEA